MSSLNFTIRRKYIQDINSENLKLYKRLNDIKPVISTEKLVKEAGMHLAEFGQRIKRYRNGGEKVDPLVKIAKRR
jgi:hypothetical protein